MKWSTGILIVMLTMLVAGLFASNIVLKREYDKMDKNDIYWNYGKVLEQHFKYLKIEGGNFTNIAFEQSPNCSVRVLHDWQRNHENPIETFVKNDTLHVKFTYNASPGGENSWMQWITMVRIFSPELLSVDGFNTKFEMFRLKQKNLSVSMSGRSKFEVESFIPDFDSLNIFQKDSSEVVFEMSPEYKAAPSVEYKDKALVTVRPDQKQIRSNEAITIQSLNADLQGNSLLDVGHAQIQSLKLSITDSSAIILSGGALRTACRQQF